MEERQRGDEEGGAPDGPLIGEQVDGEDDGCAERDAEEEGAQRDPG